MTLLGRCKLRVVRVEKRFRSETREDVGALTQVTTIQLLKEAPKKHSRSLGRHAFSAHGNSLEGFQRETTLHRSPKRGKVGHVYLSFSLLWSRLTPWQTNSPALPARVVQHHGGYSGKHPTSCLVVFHPSPELNGQLSADGMPTREEKEGV